MRRVSTVLFLIPLCLTGIALLLQCFGSEGLSVLQYQRSDISNGQVWRLLTAHLVHLNWSHFFLNCAGLVLLWLLFYKYFTQTQWLLLFFFAVLLINSAIYVFHPDILWFAGLSGVLHAFFSAGAIASFRQHGWRYSFYLLLILIKISWEQVHGALPGSVEAIGAPVMTISHIYGAAAGFLFATLIPKRRLPAV